MLYLTDEEFNFIVKLMKDSYGVNLSQKRPLIEGRLGNFVTEHGYKTYMDYFKYLQTQPEELVNIVSKLTTNHTYFMRENEHFQFYQDTVLPWIEHTLKSTDLRVWSAACSSGQEPYTIALITQNYLGSKASSWDSTILASDISMKVLSQAKQGIYDATDIEKMPPEWVSKWFKKVDDNHYQVVDALKAKVAYRYFNLLDDFNFKKPFQAIFCRNVMIYFDLPTKEAIVNKCFNAMLPGGYFFIGHSESLSGCNHKFTYVCPSVYRKE